MDTTSVAMPWQRLFERTGRTLKGWDSTDVLGERRPADFVSFGGGLPAPQLFPVEELRLAMARVLQEEAAEALQYGATEGHLPLRERIVQLMRRRGVACSPDDVLVTTGSQQALDLLGKVLLAPGQRVVVESPSYTGALQAFGLQQAVFAPFRMDADGLDVAQVRAWLERDGNVAGALYTVATYQNPSGVTLSPDRRRDLLRLSREREVPIIEDDPYSELCYEERTPPAMRSLDGGEDVIYLGTFSKILAPGLRVAWVVAPPDVIARMVVAKQGTDLYTSALTQKAALRALEAIDLDAHVARLREAYRVRRDAMLDALREEMPEGVTWTTPGGGMFLWLSLPDGMDARALLPEAFARGVGYVPGTAFHVDGGGRSAMRLSYTTNGVDQIRKGVRRLAELVRARLAPGGD